MQVGCGAQEKQGEGGLNRRPSCIEKSTPLKKIVFYLAGSFLLIICFIGRVIHF